MTHETDFEKRRGVNRVEVREGYAQVHVSQLAPPIMPARLKALRAIGNVGISIDFLKMTPSGLSCLVPANRSDDCEAALRPLGFHFSVKKGRSVVMIHGVNIRDEEGLIARIVQAAIASGVKVEHISDMHDRLLMVVPTDDANRLEERLAHELLPAKESVTA